MELTTFALFLSAEAARGRTRNRSRGVREYAGDQTAGPGRRWGMESQIRDHHSVNYEDIQVTTGPSV